MTEHRRDDTVVPFPDRREPPPADEPPPPPDDFHAPTPRSPRDLAERAVLGAMLRDPDARDAATLTLTGTDLHDHRYELIWDAIVALYSRGKPVDPISVSDQLGNTLARIGGLSELLALEHDAHAVLDAGYYAALVAKHAARGRLRSAAQAILSDVDSLDEDASTDDLHAAALSRLEAARATVPGLEQDATHPWAPIDLADIVAGDLSGLRAEILTRRDGKALLYPGAVHSVAGEPGSGKTWFALIGAAQELGEGRPVLYFDFEDRPQSLVARLLSIGVTAEQITAGLRYVRPGAALSPEGWRHVEAAADGVRLAVIDGITEVMTLHGLSLMDNEDVARWYALIPKRLADLGPAVLQIDHVVKNAENRGRFAIGGQHKLAAIDGCSYKMLTIKSFGKGVHGHAKVVLDKDKHGDVGPAGITVADVHLDATNASGSFAWLDSPEASHDEDGHFRPTTLMERVSSYLLTASGPQSLNQIKSGVKGNAASIAQAVDALAREGYVRVEPGARGGSMHHYLEAFPRADS